MNILALWGLFWILIAGTSLLGGGLAWRWWSDTLRRRRAAGAMRSRRSVALPPIAPEFLRAHARIVSLKRQVHGTAAADTDTGTSGGPPTLSSMAGRWRALIGQGTRHVDRMAAGLGWPNVLLGLLVAAGVVRGLIWEIQRHPPVPPQARFVAETIIQGFARQTSYRVPDSIPTVRAFYHRELPPRGWRYCGTQTTPRCTNLPRAGAEHEIDVYRRPDDRDFTGLTIEIWARRDRDGLTFVTLFETRLRR